jgi:hypothetical protein
MGFEACAIYSPLPEMASWTRAWQLVRSCDSYSLLRRALEEAACGDVRNDTDLGNVRAELLMREEEADNAPACFKRDQTILEEWRAMRTRISG